MQPTSPLSADCALLWDMGYAPV
uniref:Uncharacterized protein n=1 Tax=Anguilla anguilla TaxID=7936 RepID=A0A0E9PS66_ANGAN